MKKQVNRHMLIAISAALVFALVIPVSCAGPPQAEFAASVTSGQVPLTVNFTNTSRNADEFQWDFGDEATMTTFTIDEPVAHDYTRAGTHTVTLTAIKKGEPPETSIMTLTVSVKPGSLEGVKLTPEMAELDIGQSQQFSAEAVDAYDNPIPGAQLSWEIAEGVGTLTNSGLLTAGKKAGTFDEGIVVTAELGTRSGKGSASVTVKPGILKRVKLSPKTAELNIGQSQQFTAVAVDAYDNPIPEAQLNWETDEGVGTLTSSGLLIAGTKAGTFDEGIVVTVKLGTYSTEATASVTVKPDPLGLVSLPPVEIVGGITQQLEAIATDQYENPLSEIEFIWTILDKEAGSITPSGLFEAGEEAGSFEGAIQAQARQGELICSTVASATIWVPSITTPKERDVLDNGRTDFSGPRDIVWHFEWSHFEGVSLYHLYVIGPGAKYPVIDYAIVDPWYEHTSGGYIADANRLNWTCWVRPKVGDQWGAWSKRRIFNVEPVNSDPLP